MGGVGGCILLDLVVSGVLYPYGGPWWSRNNHKGRMNEFVRRIKKDENKGIDSDDFSTSK
jgi:hypothetical protein